MSIIDEILPYRKEQLMAGRKPEYIDLTTEQQQRLYSWCAWNSITMNGDLVPDQFHSVNHARSKYGRAN